MSALTFNLYLIYWTFRTWSSLHEQARKAYADIAITSPAADEQISVAFANNDTALLSHKAALLPFLKINPGLRTIGSLIPLVQIYLYAKLIFSVAGLNPDVNAFSRRQPLLSTTLVVTAFAALMFLARLAPPYHSLALLSSVAIGAVQHWLNQYWASLESKDAIVRAGFNGVEMAAIIVGAVILGFSTAGTMIGIKLH